MKSPQHSYSWMHPAFEVRDSGKYGLGIFATAAIPQETLLIACGSPILTIEDENQLPDECADLPIEISECHSFGPLAVEIDASDKINHSCDPNLGIVGQIFFVTLRGIQAGEEVCFDYAMCLSPAPGVPPYQMECHCKSSQCRRVVTDQDWRISELQHSYRNWFSWHIETRLAGAIHHRFFP